MHAESELESPPAETIRVRPGWLVAMPYWALSGALHLLLGLGLGLVVYFERQPEEESRTTIRLAKPQRVDFEAPPPRDLERKIRIPLPTSDVPVLERVVEEYKERAEELARGIDSNAVTDINLDSLFLNEAVGAGAGAAGSYGARFGKGMLFSEGGSEATESAVRAALGWLVRHQHPDGSWRAAEFHERCKKTCRGLGDRAGAGLGSSEYDIGVTALALLAFTGAGITHKHAETPEYQRAVDKAYQWLVRQQQRDPGSTEHGRIGRHGYSCAMYEHAIATMALGELLILSGDFLKLKRRVQAATHFAFRARGPKKGWRYGYSVEDADTSVTGWMLLALKTSQAAPVSISDEAFRVPMREIGEYYREMTDTTGWTHYRVKGSDRVGLPCMTGVSVMSRLFLEEPRTDRTIRQGVKHLMSSLPKWTHDDSSEVDFYHWYYATYALFQFGGEEWRVWNAAMQKALLDSQRRGDIDEDGSWDPVGRWGTAGGRVYATALGAMTLEVYYRFKRAQMRPELEDLRGAKSGG